MRRSRCGLSTARPTGPRRWRHTLRIPVLRGEMQRDTIPRVGAATPASTTSYLPETSFKPRKIPSKLVSISAATSATAWPPTCAPKGTSSTSSATEQWLLGRGLAIQLWSMRTASLVPGFGRTRKFLASGGTRSVEGRKVQVLANDPDHP